MGKKCRTVFFWAIMLLPYIGSYFIYSHYNQLLKDVKGAKMLLINKQEMNLRLIDYEGKELMNVPIATGLNPGNKKTKGDMKTPEGVFHISDIQNASDWKHDFKDGKGETEGAYGAYFIRLDTPGHKGIGIHGTHLPESIGSRTTEGCIRVHNDVLLQLVPLIYQGMSVVIIPGMEDVVMDQSSTM